MLKFFFFSYHQVIALVLGVIYLGQETNQVSYNLGLEVKAVLPLTINSIFVGLMCFQCSFITLPGTNYEFFEKTKFCQMLLQM